MLIRILLTGNEITIDNSLRNYSLNVLQKNVNIFTKFEIKIVKHPTYQKYGSLYLYTLFIY